MNRLRKIFTITAVALAAACLVLTSCAERTARAPDYGSFLWFERTKRHPVPVRVQNAFLISRIYL